MGSNSALAAASYFEEEWISILPCQTFDELFEAVDNGEAQYGMAPMENSLAGSIHAVWELLAAYKPSISGEIFYHVRHCLIGHLGAKLEDIRYVYSHPQALAQCSAFLLGLEDLDPDNILAEYDTAGAVELVKNSNKKDRAAIASSTAADLHEMQVLATDIQNHERNYTRFAVLGPRSSQSRQNKTSLVCTLDRTGAGLSEVVDAFTNRKIALHKVESRKLVNEPWAYRFYLECQGDAEDVAVAAALADVGNAVRDLSIIPSYPAARLLP